MSSVSSATPTATSQASTTSAASSGGFSSPGTFYRNLFYILIGLLCAFGLVSFLSLLRARKRRRAVVAEAGRLGLMVPGVPGYIPLRDRGQLQWTKADGSVSPDWWEVGSDKEKAEEATEKSRQMESYGLAAREVGVDFAPLAIIPPSAGPIEEAPIPASSLSYFPHHLAYRAETLMPSPSPYIANPEGLGGQNVDVVTIIRMPMPEGMYVRRAESGARGGTAVGEDEDEDEDMEAVVREWGGMELGIMKVGVEGNENGSMVRG